MDGLKQFDCAADVYAAGYAVPLYDINKNQTRWRYRGQSFVTQGPPLLCEEVKLRGNRLLVKQCS
jgi:phage-related protein